MTSESVEDERQWAAEKRDFVAARRDELAAERDAVADAMDALADARQARLDERERQLDVRAAELGSTGDSVESAVSRVADRAGRARARQHREEMAAARDASEVDRDQAGERRLAANPTTRLAAAFAEVAEHLYAADSFDEVLSRIAQAAVSTVAGCQMASVTLKQGGAFRTAATTALAASAVDEAQYDAREGPCLDAVDEALVYARAFPDTRWPTLASRPVDHGVESAASYRLAAPRLWTDGGGGSLNTYGTEPDAFNDDARNIGLILAAHAGLAAGAAHDRRDLTALAGGLQQALMSRDVIGQAKGILMERLKLTPEDAFDVLRRTSQRLNEKLRSVAVTVAQTGEFDSSDTLRADSEASRPAG
ncbi:ANTAR domain-containing protein [Terrabacter sp. Ter38]|uniref:ANTAR domain-containing protein n=1 Tax=Terrabacter sp. Ter38 TaxID=2926030 RepID=UPI002117A403|nr:ANTAR domain-containing protein [Terrabacter sp. Ter38]